MFGVQCLLLKLGGWLGVHNQDKRVVGKVLLRKLISQGQSKMDLRRKKFQKIDVGKFNVF